MKVEIETQIEVTMKMNLREARIIEKALFTDSELNNPGVDELWIKVRDALTGQEKSE